MTKTVVLNTEIFGQGPSLTLIHGWGGQNSVWKDWAQEYLAPYFQITMIELPGFGNSPKLELSSDDDINQAWLDSIIQALPKHTTLAGWSLGGLMVQQIAYLAPEKVDGLICLATTPRFVQAEGWNLAIPPELMAGFIKSLGLDAWAVLNRFWKLQLQGSDGARQLMRHIINQSKSRKLPSYIALRQGLELLRDIDMRTKLAEIQSPTLWVLGQHDPLVPKDLLSQLILLQPEAQIEVVQGAAHMPFTSHPDITAELIKEFMFKQVSHHVA